MGLKELAAMKQQLAERKVAEAAHAEREKAERASKSEDLSVRYEMLEGFLSETEKTAAETGEQIKSIEDAGELDPEMAQQIADEKLELEAVKDRIEILKSEMERVKAELGGAEGVEPKAETAQAEAPAEAVSETAKGEVVETASAEAAVEEKVEAPEGAENEKSAETIKTNDEMVEVYANLQGMKPVFRDMEMQKNKEAKQAFEYVASHPELISDFMKREKEKTPTKDKVSDDLSEKWISYKVRHDEDFRQKCLEILKRNGIEDTKGAGQEVWLPILKKEMKNLFSEAELKNHELGVAHQYFSQAENFYATGYGSGHNSRREIYKNLGETKDATMSQIENVLDAFDNFVNENDSISNEAYPGRDLLSPEQLSADIVKDSIDFDNEQRKEILERTLSILKKLEKKWTTQRAWAVKAAIEDINKAMESIEK